MLLVCNGAQKSGSTWLYNILTSLVECKAPDQKYLTGNGKNPCIRPEILGEFLRVTDIESQHYISKNHLALPAHRDLLVANENVYVFDIERDPKDVVVSSYYDAKNRNGYAKSFSTYYWTRARELIVELADYHSLWRDAGPRCHVASYEGLKNNFSVEVQAIASVLGLSLGEDEIVRLHDETSMDKLRKKYSDQELYKGDNFFRKGVVGDWENHFDESTLKDVDSIINSGFGPFDRHHIAYRMRRWLNWHLRK